MRRSLTCLAFLLLIILLGVAVRFAPVHLPWLLWKYLGSMLWAVALYLGLAMLLPRCTPRVLFVLAVLTAVLVELSRLTPERHIDAFRLTLAGKLLLGRYFSLWNIAAYVLGIVLAAWADRQFHPGHRHP